jgi:predicted ABC-type transport system involved in lysophospholipase L1 biosynthesis ATPase subunit
MLWFIFADEPTGLLDRRTGLQVKPSCAASAGRPIWWP